MAGENEEQNKGPETEKGKGTEEQNKGNEGGEGGGEGSDEEDEAPEDPKELKAYNDKLKAENKKRRLELKELKDKQNRTEQALAILQGKKPGDKGDVDAVAQAKEAADNRVRRSLLKAALAEEARDAHSIDALIKVAGSSFEDVTVDLEGEVVDREELRDALKTVRKQSAFLFGAGSGGGEGDKGNSTPTMKTPKPNPDGTGRPTGKLNEYQQWKELKSKGLTNEASEFYTKNADKIRRQMSNG